MRPSRRHPSSDYKFYGQKAISKNPGAVVQSRGYRPTNDCRAPAHKGLRVTSAHTNHLRAIAHLGDERQTVASLRGCISKQSRDRCYRRRR